MLSAAVREQQPGSNCLLVAVNVGWIDGVQCLLAGPAFCVWIWARHAECLLFLFLLALNFIVTQ